MSEYLTLRERVQRHIDSIYRDNPLGADLRTLADVSQEVQVQVEGPATLSAVLDALEAQHPTLRGTIRDHTTQERRPFIRFFVCGEDWSHESPDAPLPVPMNGATYMADVTGGQKTGLFYDQRPNHAFAAGLSLPLEIVNSG